MSDMEYYSAIKKNVFESVLEPIIQREVSQKEKKYHIYMKSRKMVLMNLLAEQQWRRRLKRTDS